MFRAMISPIFRSTRLCVTACDIKHPRRCRPATSWVHYTTSCNTQSSDPEDGQNNCPKHVELTAIINKLLLLHLVGCLYYSYNFVREGNRNVNRRCRALYITSRREFWKKYLFLNIIILSHLLSINKFFMLLETGLNTRTRQLCYFTSSNNKCEISEWPTAGRPEF